ncbi:protein of unknown function (plasmid) [Caballeronia sp. S22]
MQRTLGLAMAKTPRRVAERSSGLGGNVEKNPARKPGWDKGYDSGTEDAAVSHASAPVGGGIDRDSRVVTAPANVQSPNCCSWLS